MGFDDGPTKAISRCREAKPVDDEFVQARVVDSGPGFRREYNRERDPSSFFQQSELVD